MVVLLPHIAPTFRLQAEGTEKKRDEIAHADSHKRGDEAWQLKRMVDDPASHARGPRAVEVDGSYLRRIVGEEEIAIDGRKHGHQKQRTDA